MRSEQYTCIMVYYSDPRPLVGIVICVMKVMDGWKAVVKMQSQLVTEPNIVALYNTCIYTILYMYVHVYT